MQVYFLNAAAVLHEVVSTSAGYDRFKLIAAYDAHRTLSDSKKCFILSFFTLYHEIIN